MASAVALHDAAGPAQSPRDAIFAHPPTATQWPLFAVLATPIVGVTVLSKFTLPALGAQGIDMALLFVLAALLVGALADCIRIHPARLMMYVTLIAVLGTIQTLQPDTFSIPSLLLLVGLHLPYVFTVSKPGESERIVQFFLGIVGVIALGGIAQYLLQFVMDAHYLFPIESFTPESFIVQHYNTQAALTYGSEVYRPNGVFMLEPSFFSQLMAVGIIAELCTRARWLRLAIFAVALLVSYSGTGVMVLAICLPAYLITQRRWGLLLLGCVLLIAFISLQGVLPMGRLVSRLGEFGSTRSSGFARFVGGFFLFDQYLWDDPWRTLFGYGAGAFGAFATHARYPVAEMALFKIVFEFGLVGAALYFGFLFCCLWSSPAPRLLTLAVGLTYLLNGMYASFAHALAWGLLLWSPAPIGVPSSLASRGRAAPDLVAPIGAR